MSTSTNRHTKLRTMINQGEFRAGRIRDFTPYLDSAIDRDEVLSLVALTVDKRVRQHAETVLNELELLFLAEHGGFPLIANDVYFREGVAWILTRALLVDSEQDITDLCLQVEASGVLVMA